MSVEESVISFKFNREQWRYALLLFIPAVAVILTVSAAIAYYKHQIGTVELSAAMRNAVELSRETVIHEVGDTLSDLRILAESLHFSGDLNALTHQQKAGLADILMTFGREKQHYSQMRLLNLDGFETIRINFTDQQPSMIPDESLQDKSERYYYLNAIDLPRGEYSISLFDLNIENGVVERPYNPTLRFSMPLFNREGIRQGILVLNYRGDILLKAIHDLIGVGGNVTALLVDSEGHYLIGPDVGSEWGFMFNRPPLFAQHYPELFRQIKEMGHGVITHHDRFYAFVDLEVGTQRYHLISRGSNHSLWRMVLGGESIPVFITGLLVLLSAIVSFALASARVAVAEKSLSEDRLADFEETSNDWLWETDAQMQLTNLSSRLGMIAGIDPDSFIGRSIDELLAVEAADETASLSHYRESMTAVSEILCRLESDHANSMLFSVNAKPYYHAGTFAGYRGSARDVTDYRALSQELQARVAAAELAEERSDNFARQLADAQRISRTGSWSYDVLTGQLVCSKEVYRILGMDESSTPLTLDELKRVIHEEDREQAADLFQQAVEYCKGYEAEFRFIRQNDQMVCWLHLKCVCILDDEANVVLCEGSLQEITERKSAERELQHREETIRMLLNSSGDGMYAIDLENNCFMINPAALGMLGYDSQEEIIGRSAHTLFQHTHADGVPYSLNDCPMRQVALTGESVHIANEVFWRKDGSSFPVEYHAYPVIRDDEIVGSIVSFHDISTRVEAIRQLQNSEQDLRNVFSSVGEGIAIYDFNGHMLEVNPVICNRLGYKREEMLEMSPSDFDDPEVAGEIPDRLRILKNKGGMRFETVHITKTGHRVPTEVNASIIKFRGSPAVLCSARDITDRKKAEEQILRLANNDSLTGLSNRHYFNLRFKESLSFARRYGQRVGLLMVDLDDFKPINDLYGHQFGDKALSHVASLLGEICRDSDTVARIGGDEFAVLVTSPASDLTLEQPARRIIQDLSSPMLVDGRRIKMGASIGIALFPDDGDDCETLMRKADRALYEVKRGGRNDFRFYDPSMILS